MIHPHLVSWNVWRSSHALVSNTTLLIVEAGGEEEGGRRERQKTERGRRGYQEYWLNDVCFMCVWCMVWEAHSGQSPLFCQIRVCNLGGGELCRLKTFSHVTSHLPWQQDGRLRTVIFHLLEPPWTAWSSLESAHQRSVPTTCSYLFHWPIWRNHSNPITLTCTHMYKIHICKWIQ